MEPEEYGRTAAAEDRHFWFREARSIWQALLQGVPEPEGPASRPPGRRMVLDAGCGTGGNLRALEAAPRICESHPTSAEWQPGSPPARATIGLDLSPIALGLARTRVQSPLVRGSVLALPFREQVFDLVLCADVLYHEDVRDEFVALQEIRRVLRPGGYFCINVPAFGSLRSAHDRAMHTARRYTRGGLRTRLIRAGFVPSRVLYWNGLLFLPAVLVRLVRRGGRSSEIGMPPPALNALLWLLARCDAALALAGLLPAGLSVAAMARRYDGQGNSG